MKRNCAAVASLAVKLAELASLFFYFFTSSNETLTSVATQQRQNVNSAYISSFPRWTCICMETFVTNTRCCEFTLARVLLLELSGVLSVSMPRSDDAPDTTTV